MCIGVFTNHREWFRVVAMPSQLHASEFADLLINIRSLQPGEERACMIQDVEFTAEQEAVLVELLNSGYDRFTLMDNKGMNKVIIGFARSEVREWAQRSAKEAITAAGGTNIEMGRRQ